MFLKSFLRFAPPKTNCPFFLLYAHKLKEKHHEIHLYRM